jgi:DNA-binding transcriptional MerR regulator
MKTIPNREEQRRTVKGRPARRLPEEAVKIPAGNSGGCMTVKEIAELLGCTVRTVRNHIQRCFPGLMRHSKKTHLTEAQVTVILESMKKGFANPHNYIGNTTVPNVETSMTDEFRLALLYKQDAELMKEAASLEHALRLKAETKLGKTERRLGQEIISHDRTRSGLSMYQRIAEAAGLVTSDRDDMIDTYRRQGS